MQRGWGSCDYVEGGLCGITVRWGSGQRLLYRFGAVAGVEKNLTPSALFVRRANIVEAEAITLSAGIVWIVRADSCIDSARPPVV